MFDQIKQVRQLQKLQAELKKEKVEVEDGGVRVVVNGKMEVEEVEIDDSVSQAEAGRKVKKCLNDAMSKVQMTAAKKMQAMR